MTTADRPSALTSHCGHHAVIAKIAREVHAGQPPNMELSYPRDQGWRAWIVDRPRAGEPSDACEQPRNMLARGCGPTPDEACAAAIFQLQGNAARASGAQ